MRNLLETIRKHVWFWRYSIATGLLVAAITAGLISVAQTETSRSANKAATATDTTQTQSANKPQVAAAQQSMSSTTDQKSQQTQQAAATTTNLSAQPPNQSNLIDNPKNLFANLPLSAESVIVWNQADNEIIYEKQARKEQPLASITKLMTALVATENTTASTTAVVNTQHLQATGEYGLQAEEQWPIDELITFMLVRSANDAARAVASATVGEPNDGYASQFVDLMNQTANRLGLSDTYFFNPSGLDINEELISGGYGTAYDTARLFDYIDSNHPTLLTPTTQPTVSTHTKSGKQYSAENTNKTIEQYSNNSYGSKTGYTVLAGGNLVMGFQLEEPIVIAVFGSTKDGRFDDMQQLYQATKQYFDITN